MEYITSVNSSEKPQTVNFFDSPTAKIVGFISDLVGIVGGIIGIATFLLAFRHADGNLQIPLINLPLTPLHILGLWVVSAYISVCLLYSSWKKKKDEHFLKDSFWISLKYDFIIQFRYPFLLLPCIILFILLIWIVIETVMWNGILIFTIILCFVTIFLYIAFFSTVFSSTYEKQVKAFKKDVDTNWTYWENRIKSELKKRGVQHITTDGFTDIIDSWEIQSEDITYIFMRYAHLHYNQVKYGNVYSYKDDNPFYPNKILAKHNAEWSDNYYFC